MDNSSEFIERHDAKVVLAASQEPVSVTATVIWETPKQSDYITIPVTITA